jgi:hypothetical protein
MLLSVTDYQTSRSVLRYAGSTPETPQIANLQILGLQTNELRGRCSSDTYVHAYSLNNLS